MAGVQTATFHQCRFGLTSPEGHPMKKKTGILTNHPGVFKKFNGKFCQCTVEHRAIEGSEGGKKVSTWAAV